MGTRVVAEVRAALATAGNAERAAQQQAYMKSEMPFRGVTTPELRALLRPLLRGYDPPGREVWEGDVRELWDGATHREERYAAITLARHRAARPWQQPQALGLYRHLVLTGCWWDYVDPIAAHLVGGVLARHPDPVTPVIREWARDPNPWLRRTAVLCQLGRKADTDRELLRFVIEGSLQDRSFWLRKAIGWSLRDFARTDPEWVVACVEALEPGISPLSRREALKHLADRRRGRPASGPAEPLGQGLNR